jgi:DNA-binding LacI/PurR family transcriptional regulator
MATIKEIAADAGVSIATVSHVVNKSKFVKPETAARIQRSIDRLGYRKDDVAVWLKTAAMPIVVMASPHADTSFFDDVAGAIETAFAAHDLSVLRVQVSTLDRLLQSGQLGFFLTRASGLVVLGHSDDWLTDETKLEGLAPGVMLNWDRIDDFSRQGLVERLDRGPDIALSYLAERGHRDIGLMTGPLMPRAIGLLDGSRAAAHRLGLNLDPAWTVQSSYGLVDARERVHDMLSRTPRPTAIFTFGTQFAFGALQAAYDLKLRVPEDLSVISYIECRQAEFSAPLMTTVSPSIPQLASHVVQRVRALSAGGADLPDTTLDIELIERASVARIG